jgi:hypothetical protein
MVDCPEMGSGGIFISLIFVFLSCVCVCGFIAGASFQPRKRGW